MKLFYFFFIFVILPFEAKSADFVLKWGVNVEPVVYFKKAAAEFKRRVEKRSNGKIEVQVFENVVPQEGHDHLGDVKNGVYHMNQETVFQLEKHIPELAIWNLPFLFETDSQVIRYTSSPHAQDIMKKLDAHGMMGLGYTYSGGFLYIFGAKIDSFADLHKTGFGLEESSPAYRSYLSKMGIDGRDIDFEGVKDNSLKASEIIASTSREIFPLAGQKPIYLNTSNHRVISRILFISKSFLASLPEDLRKIVIEEGQRAASYERSLSIRDKKAVLKEVSRHNIQMNEWTTPQRAQEKSRFDALYKVYFDKFGSEGPELIQSLKR